SKSACSMSCVVRNRLWPPVPLNVQFRQGSVSLASGAPIATPSTPCTSADVISLHGTAVVQPKFDTAASASAVPETIEAIEIMSIAPLCGERSQDGAPASARCHFDVSP